jgi:hypothetical protein
MEAIAVLFSSLIVILAMVGAAVYGYQVGYRDGSEDMSEFVQYDQWYQTEYDHFNQRDIDEIMYREEV